MSWNHRVVRHRDGSMEIVEVYYDDETTEDAGPFGWSEAGVFAEANESPSQIERLREQIEWFRRELDKPPLDVSDKCLDACCRTP